jgi:phosphorylcholine metabolism protein LicD
MITNLQMHLMKLIQEIDETCAEYKLPYSLYGRTAGCAENDGEFTTGCYQFQIMMLAGDILTLKEKLLKKYPENRAIEDFSVNPDLQYHYIRYVDTGTTIFDKNHLVKYKMPGVAVTIIPLYCEGISRICEVVETGFIYMNGSKIFDEQDESPEAERVAQCIHLTKMALKVFGKKWAANRIYNSLKKEKGKKPPKSLIIRGDSDTQFPDLRKRIKGEYLFDTKRIPFEGMMLPVPTKSEAYYKYLYGKEWKKLSKTPLPTQGSMNVIWDDYVPFKEYQAIFAEQGIDMNEIYDQEREFNYFNKNTLESLELKSFNYLYRGRRSVKRIDLYLYYRDKMDALKKAEEENDMETIKTIMKRYIGTVKRYEELGVGFYINKELHHYAELVWKQRKGYQDYGDMILEMVPEEYLEKDMETFLKDYIPE